MLLAHLAATLFVVGVVWSVQVIHYPLFKKAGTEKCALYSEAHSRLTDYMASPPILAEAGTALLLILHRPEGVPLAAALVGLILVALIWASTALLQMPCHTAISSGFDEGDHKGLVLSNRVRAATPAQRARPVLDGPRYRLGAVSPGGVWSSEVVHITHKAHWELEEGVGSWVTEE